MKSKKNYTDLLIDHVIWFYQPKTCDYRIKPRSCPIKRIEHRLELKN